MNRNRSLAIALGIATISTLAALPVLGCGGSDAAVTPATGTAPVAPTVAPTVAPAAPTTLTLGAPATTLQVPALPGFTLAVAAAGEYQIDAMGAPLDAQLYLFRDGQVVVTDGDSGDGVDARIVRFLDAGTYEIRVGEWQVRQMSARVQVQQLPPLTSVASIAPGAPPMVVNAPQGDSPRNASAEITLTIATAGTYRIDVTDPSAQFDPELQLIQNGALVAQDSDSGGNRAAQLIRPLTPGEYRLRVRDWVNRAAPVTVTVAAQ